MRFVSNIPLMNLQRVFLTSFYQQNREEKIYDASLEIIKENKIDQLIKNDSGV